MSRKVMILFVCGMLIGLTACGKTENAIKESYATEGKKTESESIREETKQQDNSDEKVLVAYFTYAENIGDTSNMSVDAIASASIGTTANTEGNLQVIAETIQQTMDADVFHIVVKEPYDADYATMRNRALNEISNNILPELKETVENLDQYDVVYLGTPVWSGSLPQPVVSFLTENDLTGKTVIPFGIHLGSRFGKMLEQIEELCPGSTLLDGFTVEAGTDNDEVRAEVIKWLKDE